MDDDDRLRGLPRDLMQDIKRAAYEAKVREMEDRQFKAGDGSSAPFDDDQHQGPSE